MFVGDAQSLGFRTSSEPFDTLRERTGTFYSELIQIDSINAERSQFSRATGRFRINLDRHRVNRATRAFSDNQRDEQCSNTRFVDFVESRVVIPDPRAFVRGRAITGKQSPIGR